MSENTAQDDKERKSELYILLPDGSINLASENAFSSESDLGIFYKYENSGSREFNEPPVHVKMMQDLDLVNYEPAADAGNFRWLPKGHLLKRLMEGYVSGIVREYGGMQVETPIMYSLDHPQLSEYLARFPARQYQLLSGDKKFFLRFAACFGQYLIMRDMQISYTHLPVRLYELTHYSFRREHGGELAGMRRLRGFTMPDMHTLCADNEQAKQEFFSQYLLCKQWMEGLGVKYVMALRVVKEFFDANKEFVLSIAKDFGQPILLEVWEKRYFYFVLKFEFNVVDEQKKAAALATVQIDVENTKRFDITYVDSDGSRKHPLMLHASISGSIDRNLYALLEGEARKVVLGQVPKLPYWLTPTQVMLVPVSDKHIPACVELAKMIGNHVRVEVNDLSEGVSKKVRLAELRWVPFIVVIGDREIESKTFSVRIRGIKEQQTLSLDRFSALLYKEQNGMPFEPINWPLLLSKQPHYR
jgi:threonyl-tRNA synthetase